ncbi:hypothetical protein ONZ45_g5391 [Pleurotus djamor]|nr:hypothetical protein ONZ45_g5391 [Pleurotus djamor]
MVAGDIPLTRIRNTDQSKFLVEQRTGPPPSPQDVNDIFAEPQSFEDEVCDTIEPIWRRDLFALMERPNSSSQAFMMHILITALIAISALVTILETVPAFHYISTRFWFGLETSLVALFTVEYVARCLAWSNTWGSLFKWATYLLSILPYYVETILQQDTSVLFRFSILRMFRLLRVFKPFRYNNTILLTIEVMYLSVRRSQHALLAISFFVIMVLTVFSTLLYFAERGTWDSTLETFINVDGDPTQFASIPAAAWFVLVTITTVGYGEITPRSFLGRLVTLPLLLFGLLLIALPSFVLGREFSIVWERMNQHHRPNDDPDSPSHPSFDHNLFGAPPSSRSESQQSARDRDLSNFKLAQNQTELSSQISELRTLVEMQGKHIQRLMLMMEANSKGKGRDVDGVQ